LFLQATNATNYQDLPEEVIPNILRYVPLKQRLTQCALVSRMWASAAALATVHVEHKPTTVTLPAFQNWLHQHAGQLLSLRLFAEADSADLPEHTISLPLHKLSLLQHLELSTLEVLLPCDAHGSAVQPGLLGSLQHLNLDTVGLVGIDSLKQLTQATKLTHLVLEDVSIGGVQYIVEMYDKLSDSPWPSSKKKRASVRALMKAVPGILQRLPRLSVLELPAIPMTAAAVQQLAALKGLRQVTLQHTGHAPMFDLQHLPRSITQLCVHGQTRFEDQDQTALPLQLPQLPGLLRLEMAWCTVPLTLLGSVNTKLQECWLLPWDPEDDDIQPEGTATLLDTLPRFTHLQDLNLDLELDTETIDPQRFSSLTFSSSLTSLSLTSAGGPALPAGAVQHMFPAGRQLPALEDLTIESHLPAAEGFCLDTGALAHVVNACPSLVCLDIIDAVKPGADLSPLLQLPESCTSLHIGDARFKPAAAAVLDLLPHVMVLD
jgi:hypothetical protein